MTTTEKHGGQDIYDNMSELIDDFSVTTNYLGPVSSALEHITENIHMINHYPKDDKEPYITNLTNWLYKNQSSVNPYIILGNGASEVIDLLCRTVCYDCAEYTSFYVNPTQYMEYERSLKLQNLSREEQIEKADIVSIVNPCNPTGDYLSVQELKKLIDRCKQGSTVIVDESMALWIGPQFREETLLSQYDYIKVLLKERNIKVFIIHSYTKFFSCTGLRIGSVLCPDEETYKSILYYQNPWSNNILSLEYLDKCLEDDEYANKTWNTTTSMRQYQVGKIEGAFPEWKIYGVSFISWMWIKLPTEREAEKVYKISKEANMPIRWGKVGYNKPKYVRVAVRDNNNFDLLLNIWKTEMIEPVLPIEPNTVHRLYNNMRIFNKRVPLASLKFHEEFVKDKFNCLYNYYISLSENVRIIPTIIIDEYTNVIIDGHHRYQLFKKLGYKEIEVTCIDYLKFENIIVNPQNRGLTKEDVIAMGLSSNVYKAKTTQHVIRIGSKIQPIIYLSTNILLN